MLGAHTMSRLISALPFALLLSSLGCSDASQEGTNAASENDLADININWSARGTVTPINPACEVKPQLPEDGPTCGLTDLAPPDPYSLPDDDDDQGAPFVDLNRELKDIGTTFVVQQIFGTPDTLYNFMAEVYGKLDARLAAYRQAHSLPDKAMFILFKGGNVLRVVAQSYFDLLLPAYRDILEEEYADNFKRSDADFSIYIDETLVQNYDQVLEEVTEMAFDELNNIRSDFFANPEFYFDFLRFKNDYASGEMQPYLSQAKQIGAITDPNNPTWNGANILQMELLDAAAAAAPACRYHGQFDYEYVLDPVTNAINATPRSRTRNWIFNSSNQTLQWTWGSDPTQIVKFYLVRSKIAFEYVYEQNGQRKNKDVGGELIDVSIPHRDDDRLRHFLDHYDDNVHDYTLISDDGKNQQMLKAYSLKYLADDLEFIIFDSFDRPWHGGGKYQKRVYRLFFLYILDLLNNSVDAADQTDYLASVQDLLDQLRTFYATGTPSQDVIAQAGSTFKQILNTPAPNGRYVVRYMNTFWSKLLGLMQRMVDSPQPDDMAGFNAFVNDFIQSNVDNANIDRTPGDPRVDLEEIYTVNVTQLL